MPLSSSGQGHILLKAVTRVQIPVGASNFKLNAPTLSVNYSSLRLKIFTLDCLKFKKHKSYKLFFVCPQMLNRRYKFLIMVGEDKVATAEEIFRRHYGKEYLKRKTTSNSPEFLMNAIRMHVPKGQVYKTVSMPLEPRNELTLCYIVDGVYMEGLKKDLRESEIAGYRRETPVSYQAHNLTAKLCEIPDNLKIQWHLLKFHVRETLGL